MSEIDIKSLETLKNRVCALESRLRGLPFVPLRDTFQLVRHHSLDEDEEEEEKMAYDEEKDIDEKEELKKKTSTNYINIILDEIKSEFQRIDERINRVNENFMKTKENDLCKLSLMPMSDEKIDGIENQLEALDALYDQSNKLHQHSKTNTKHTNTCNNNQSVRRIDQKPEDNESMAKFLAKAFRDKDQYNILKSIIEENMSQNSDQNRKVSHGKKLNEMKTIANKVSRDHFENVCDSLQQKIQSILSKTIDQEATWTNTLNDVKQEINSKISKNDFTTLQSQLNKKLKAIKQHVDALYELTSETAGGAKYLSYLNCLSCGRSAIMKGTALPTKPMHVTRKKETSIGPSIALELNKLRQKKWDYVMLKSLDMGIVERLEYLLSE